MKAIYLSIIVLALAGCARSAEKTGQTTGNDSVAVEVENVPQGAMPDPTYVEEIALPEGYERVAVEDTTSFAYFLRNLKLKPLGTPIYTYDGRESSLTNYAYAVIDGYDTGTEDIQQCADAIIRLRAEWLYAHRRYDDIAFHFTNGWLCDYKHWAEGYRVSVQGNKTSWYQAKKPDYGYPTFRKYLDMVFYYAGTISLSKELKQVNLVDMQIGDVFITSGSPGHAILVIDVAQNAETHDKCFILAESYMPAQDIHILENDRGELTGTPWFSVNRCVEKKSCKFPTWYYDMYSLKRF